MGRFKYIPQEYTKLTEEKAMVESDIWEINVKRKEEDDDIIDNTLIVYDDYKIPLNITEQLAIETLEVRNKINDLYDKIKNINDILDKTYIDYEIFEDKIFGKMEYIHSANKFSDNVICEPLKGKRDGGGKLYETISTTIPLEFEMQRLDYIIGCHEYNRKYIEHRDLLINREDIFNDNGKITDRLIEYMNMYESVKDTLSDEKFWEKEISDMYNEYIKSATLYKNLDSLAFIEVTIESKGGDFIDN